MTTVNESTRANRKENAPSTWQFLSRQRVFAKLLAARHVSVIGDNVHTIANMVLVQQLTGSATAMGAVFVANTIPRIIFSLLGGVSVDRYDRRLILIACDLVRALGVLVLVGLALLNQLQVWHVALFAAMNGAAQSFAGPAVSAVVPSIVERKDELQKANALAGMNVRIAGILGSAVGGMMIAALGVWIGYTVDAVSYLLSALVLSSMIIPSLDQLRAQPATQGPSGVWRDFIEGVQYAASQRALLMITLLSMMITMVAIPVAQLLPSFAASALRQMDAEQVGLLWSGMTFGLLLGALSLNSMKISNKVLGVLLSAVLYGGASVLLGFSQGFVAALGCMILLGFGLGWATVLPTTLFQMLVPQDMLGRFFGNIGLISLGTQPLIMWLAGIAADAYSPATVFVALGTLLLISSLFWMLQYRPTLNAVQMQERVLAMKTTER